MLAQSQAQNTVHNMHQLKGGAIAARQLARRATTVTPQLTCQSVVDMFNADVQLYALPVVDDSGVVLGVLRSMDVLRRGTDKFFAAITGRQSCVKIMDENPLVFDANATLRTMSEVVSSLNDRHLVDGYIVSEDGRYFGSGKMTDLLKAVSDMQIFSARYANPLTFLPGNVPIDEHIKECLEKQSDFVVAYFDLDHFKAFNDVYGYRAGDEVIQLAAQVISSHADSAADFVGHVGGDDFVVVFGSGDWEQRVQRVLTEFDHSVQPYFSQEHLAAGGLTTQNRQGVEVFHPLTGLSAGLVVVRPNSVESPSELSQRLAETKKLAKRQAGSSYFVDRRGSGV
jgi:GGDEF domain-containing protein